MAPRKEKEVKDVEVTEEEVSESEAEANEVAEPAGKGSFSVTASFKTRTNDGDRITHKFVGSGKTVEDALVKLSNIEDETPFPKGINMLVTATVARGDYKFERNLAPHVARDIFENNNVLLFKKLMGV